jgi:hypothetical protein
MEQKFFKITDFEKTNIEATSAIIETENGQIEILPNHCEIMCSGKLLKYSDENNSYNFGNSNIFIFYFSKNILQIL